jgi:hypothetical protein
MHTKMMMSLMLVLAVASCGGDGILGPADDGTANINASGAVSASGGGIALFQSVSSGGTSIFQIAVAPSGLGGDAGLWQLQIVRYAERPPAGTYQLTALSPSSPNPTANFYYTAAGEIEMFNATSGELFITSSTPSIVRGTFTFTAQSTTNSARTVTVQGAFAALCPSTVTCS